MEQTVLVSDGDYRELDSYFRENNTKKILLVCGRSFRSLRISKYFESLSIQKGIECIVFDRFLPNPDFNSVVEGVKIFCQNDCGLIVAAGGGSTIDVAKCIKLYCNMRDDTNYLEQAIIPNSVKLIAIPTTAGSGSEATRFAVIYYNGEKQSVMDDSCMPSLVFMDASTLKTLPEYQKKSTMLDAFCHAVESYWSVNSTDESKRYSRKSIRIILSNMEGYLAGGEKECGQMLWAAHYAGKAINITQTTAGHAMCYKLTSLYGISHGHAAALCVEKLWPYMLEHMGNCVDPRGVDYLSETFEEMSALMGVDSAKNAAEKFQQIVCFLQLKTPKPNKEDFTILRESVNMDRLKNNPVKLEKSDINELYHQILKVDKEL